MPFARPLSTIAVSTALIVSANTAFARAAESTATTYDQLRQMSGFAGTSIVLTGDVVRDEEAVRGLPAPQNEMDRFSAPTFFRVTVGRTAVRVDDPRGHDAVVVDMVSGRATLLDLAQRRYRVIDISRYDSPPALHSTEAVAPPNPYQKVTTIVQNLEPRTVEGEHVTGTHTQIVIDSLPHSQCSQLASQVTEDITEYVDASRPVESHWERAAVGAAETASNAPDYFYRDHSPAAEAQREAKQPKIDPSEITHATVCGGTVFATPHHPSQTALTVFWQIKSQTSLGGQRANDGLPLGTFMRSEAVAERGNFRNVVVDDSFFEIPAGFTPAPTQPDPAPQS